MVIRKILRQLLQDSRYLSELSFFFLSYVSLPRIQIIFLRVHSCINRMHICHKNGICAVKTDKLTFLEVLNSPRETPTTLLSSWNSAHFWRLENLEARSIANNSCAGEQNTKPELGVQQTEAIRLQSSQDLWWTHRRIWTSKSTVSWLLLGPVVSGSILTQSEVEGSATTTSSSCCVSGAWYSGEGGFISLTSSLPFSTLRKSIKGMSGIFSYIGRTWNMVNSFIRTCTQVSLRPLDM